MKICAWCNNAYPKPRKYSHKQYEQSTYCSKSCANRGLSEANTTDPIERFWSKVDKSGECWLWTAGLTSEGYGQFSPDHTTTALAHRISYTLTKGQIPAGLQLDHRHTCPRRCVNPAHLRPVTAKQNCENRCGTPRNNRSSGVMGVHRYRDGRRWIVHVRHNRRSYYGGIYGDLDVARRAVVALRKKLFTHNDADRASA